MPKKSAQSSGYSLTLLVGDKTYQANGATLKSAMKAVKPNKLGGKIWLTVKKGEGEYQFTFNKLRWELLFVKPTFMDIFEKKVKMFVG